MGKAILVGFLILNHENTRFCFPFFPKHGILVTQILVTKTFAGLAISVHKKSA